MSYTSSRCHSPLKSAGRNALLLSLCLLVSLSQIQLSQAQPTQIQLNQVQSEQTLNDLQQGIDEAVSILQQLDTLATACLSALNTETEVTSEATGELCTKFINGIDGDLLGQYLAHCRTLKNWRDEFVTQQFTAQGTAKQSSANYSEEELQRLIGIDYTCGEDALQQRTQFVTTAFGKLQQSSAASRQQNSALNRRFAEIDFDRTLNSERQRLQHAVQQQQLQRDLESKKQLRQVENELIRQQRNQTIPTVQ